jgi:hypothetical protein
MPVFSMRGRRVRGAAVVAAAVAVLGAAPAQAVADDGSAPVLTQDALSLMLDDNGEPSQVVTQHPDGSYSYVGPTTAKGFRDSLSVGAPVFTGAYKTIISGPHVTKVKVYVRSFHACKGQVVGLVQNCMSGTITYAAGFAACFSYCTVGGQRGSQHCHADGSDTNGLTSDLAACWNTLLSNGYASKAVETDKVCVPAMGCSNYSWHLNAYPTGNITGPYSGEGVA